MRPTLLSMGKEKIETSKWECLSDRGGTALRLNDLDRISTPSRIFIFREAHANYSGA